MTLEDFKANAENIKKEISMRNDIIDLDNGTMTIFSENINKYLEQYICKNAEDLEKTLWFSYGIFVKVID